MKPRARLLAALLALFAFSASFAEQVWASACGRDVAGVPSSFSPTMGTAGGHADMAVPPGPHGSGHSPAVPGHDECPLLALAGGCTLLSLPAAAVVPAASARAPEVRISIRMDRAPDLLLPSSLFHPPQL
ncbi:MAG TPA: hypothetical protein VFQ76_07675 [Longimicrobiaceae bacterium]|nr:hypothetical protein [Longimicrobiaceae bacterium]